LILKNKLQEEKIIITIFKSTNTLIKQEIMADPMNESCTQKEQIVMYSPVKVQRTLTGE